MARDLSSDDDSSTTSTPAETVDVGPGWDMWLEDEWYRPLVEYKKTGSVMTSDTLSDSELGIIRQAASRIVLVDRTKETPLRTNQIGYRERNEKISKCIPKKHVRQYLEILHDIYRHFAERNAYGTSRDIYTFRLHLQY